MEENKESEALTHEAYVGDLGNEEDAKVDELISANLDIEQDPFSELQIQAQEPSRKVGEAMGEDPVKKDGQDVGDNVEVQTEGRDEVEADKTSELVEGNLKALENAEKPNQDVEYQTGDVSEKEPGSQEELHVDISMFAGGEERNPSDAVVTENSGDVAAVTEVLGDENIGDGRSGTDGTLVEIPNQIDSGVTDEKDKDANEDVRNDVNNIEVNGKGGVNDFSGSGKVMGPFLDSEDDGTEEEQAAFLKDLESFYRQEHGVEFKTPKFYKTDLNLLKLWRAVIPLGGYEQVTSCKLWRQVGESFNPPKTCTTISYAFRIFYEKALFEYEKHLTYIGALCLPGALVSEYVAPQHQLHTSASGRARRDSATRAMQGWHANRLGNGDAVHTVNKEKNGNNIPTKEKQLDTIGTVKRKLPSPVEQALRVVRTKTDTQQFETSIVDAGIPASWVKINVLRTRESFEIYCLVPGLLREEVKVQSDPAGRVVITGEPEQLDNPWGVTPFKKVVTVPSRINPHQTSAVLTLHGQLYIRVPIEQPNV